MDSETGFGFYVLLLHMLGVKKASWHLMQDKVITVLILCKSVKFIC